MTTHAQCGCALDPATGHHIMPCPDEWINSLWPDTSLKVWIAVIEWYHDGERLIGFSLDAETAKRMAEAELWAEDQFDTIGDWTQPWGEDHWVAQWNHGELSVILHTEDVSSEF